MQIINNYLFQNMGGIYSKVKTSIDFPNLELFEKSPDDNKSSEIEILFTNILKNHLILSQTEMCNGFLAKFPGICIDSPVYKNHLEYISRDRVPCIVKKLPIDKKEYYTDDKERSYFGYGDHYHEQYDYNVFIPN